MSRAVLSVLAAVFFDAYVHSETEGQKYYNLQIFHEYFCRVWTLCSHRYTSAGEKQVNRVLHFIMNLVPNGLKFEANPAASSSDRCDFLLSCTVDSREVKIFAEEEYVTTSIRGTKTSQALLYALQGYNEEIAKQKQQKPEAPKKEVTFIAFSIRLLKDTNKVQMVVYETFLNQENGIIFKFGLDEQKQNGAFKTKNIIDLNQYTEDQTDSFLAAIYDLDSVVRRKYIPPRTIKITSEGSEVAETDISERDYQNLKTECEKGSKSRGKTGKKAEFKPKRQTRKRARLEHNKNSHDNPSDESTRNSSHSSDTSPVSKKRKTSQRLDEIKGSNKRKQDSRYQIQAEPNPKRKK